MVGAVAPPTLRRLPRLVPGRGRGPRRAVSVATLQPPGVVARTTHNLRGAVARAVLPETIAKASLPVQIGTAGRRTARFNMASRPQVVVFQSCALIVGDDQPEAPYLHWRNPPNSELRRARNRRRQSHLQTRTTSDAQQDPATLNRTVVVGRLGR